MPDRGLACEGFFWGEYSVIANEGRQCRKSDSDRLTGTLGISAASKGYLV